MHQKLYKLNILNLNQILFKMKKIIFTIGMLLSFVLNAQQVKTVKYEALPEHFNQNDKLTVVNFWATWCGPCVNEIPYFVQANERFKDQVNFVYVSLDQAKQLQKVEAFAKNQDMTGTLLLLDDAKRMNEWIPAIHKGWQGNIPITVFYKNGEKLHFHGEEIDQQRLIEKIEQLK